MQTPDSSRKIARRAGRSRPWAVRARLRLVFRSWRPPWSWPTRLAFLYAGVLLPIVCFTTGFQMQPRWQSGNWDDYTQMLLTPKLSSPLHPFLLYSMTCLVLLVVKPERFVKRFVVRFGVYSGLLLAVQYMVLFGVAMGFDGPQSLGALVRLVVWALVTVAVPWFVGWLINRLHRRFGSVVHWASAALILVAVVALAVPVVAFSLLFATLWAAACYGVVAVYAFRHAGSRRFRYSLMQLMGVTTWLAAFFGAWRASALWMLAEYAKLPTTPPDDCYVCTAAARGHRRLVGAENCVVAGGVYRANDQMRRLKAAELLLAAGFPRAHGLCRRVYDRLGPPLAARLGAPLLADAAYLALKPAEWLARAAFAALLPGRAAMVKKLYR